MLTPPTSGETLILVTPNWPAVDRIIAVPPNFPTIKSCLAIVNFRIKGEIRRNGGTIKDEIRISIFYQERWTRYYEIRFLGPSVQLLVIRINTINSTRNVQRRFESKLDDNF